MLRLRHVTAVLAVLAATVTATAACGSDDTSTAGAKDTKSIAITFDGTTVTPNGERVDVALGQKVEFVVKADAPGEIHVHSEPEQELEYKKGTTILELGSFDKAGIIEVESHHLEKTIVQLEVK